MTKAVLIILAVAIAIVSAGIVLIDPSLMLTGPPDSDPDDLAQWESETRQMLILVIGGLATLATILGGLVKIGQAFAEKRAKEQREQDKDKSSNSRYLDQRLDIGRSRFDAAVEQLGQSEIAYRVKALRELEDLAASLPSLLVPTIDQLTIALRRWRALEIHPMYLASGFDVPNDAGFVVLLPSPDLEPLETESQIAIDILGRLLKKRRATVDLSDLNFDRARFRDGIFRDVDFSRCSLACADFSGADLRDAILSGRMNSAKGTLNAAYADFSDANLSGADLSLGYFQFADFSGANLDGAEMSGTNTRYATGLTSENLNKARNAEHARALSLGDIESL